MGIIIMRVHAATVLRSDNMHQVAYSTCTANQSVHNPADTGTAALGQSVEELHQNLQHKEKIISDLQQTISHHERKREIQQL